MGILTTIATNVFGGSSISMYLAIALVTVTLISGGLLKYSLSQIEKKDQQIVALNISVAEQKKVIVQMAADTQHIQEINTALTTVERANVAKAGTLSDTLQKLNKAALDNPSLTESKINQASKDRNRCLALVTGAKKTEKEINRVCPQVLGRK